MDTISFQTEECDRIIRVRTVPIEGFSLVASVSNKPPAVFSSASAICTQYLINHMLLIFDMHLMQQFNSSNILDIMCDVRRLDAGYMFRYTNS